MFLQSSKHTSGRSKILSAAIEVDKDFRKFRKVRSRTFQQTRTATTIVQSNDNLFPSAMMLD